jgi:hypothetical protein
MAKIQIDWSRFEVQPVDPKELKPHPRNSRLHNKRQRKALLELIKKVGWSTPLLVSRRSGYLVNGHERRELAIENKIPEVPVIYLDLDERQELLLLTTYDHVGSLAEIDHELLGLSMRELGGAELNLEAFGYEPGILEALTGGDWRPEEAKDQAAASSGSKRKKKAEIDDEHLLQVNIDDQGIFLIIKTAFDHWSLSSSEKPSMVRFFADLAAKYLEANQGK